MQCLLISLGMHFIECKPAGKIKPLAFSLQVKYSATDPYRHCAAGLMHISHLLSHITSSLPQSTLILHINLITIDMIRIGKTTAVIAVMRGKPKDGYHCRRSNKHYTWTLVLVLLDNGSDGDLVFVSKDKLMMLPYSKRLILCEQGQTHATTLLKKAGFTGLEYFKWDFPV